MWWGKALGLWQVLFLHLNDLGICHVLKWCVRTPWASCVHAVAMWVLVASGDCLMSPGAGPAWPWRFPMPLSLRALGHSTAWFSRYFVHLEVSGPTCCKQQCSSVSPLIPPFLFAFCIPSLAHGKRQCEMEGVSDPAPSLQGGTKSAGGADSTWFALSFAPECYWVGPGTQASLESSPILGHGPFQLEARTCLSEAFLSWLGNSDFEI